MSSPWNPDRYLEAYHFAALAHRGQTFPGTDIAYIMHLSFVCTEVVWTLQQEGGHDGDLAVSCALLHDTMEDTRVTYDDIAERFGQQVAEGVAALTKDPRVPKAHRMAESLERIKLQPHAVWLVKLADRTANMQSPPAHWSPEKRVAYQVEAREIHSALAEASPVLAARLAAKIDAYDAYL